LHRINESPSENTKKHEGIAAHPLCDYVKAIREVCEYYSIPVLDLYKESGMACNVREYCDLYAPDGLHPNDAGHAILAHKIKNFLERL
jgi:lysophospholipase L1-like esterase